MIGGRSFTSEKIIGIQVYPFFHQLMDVSKWLVKRILKVLKPHEKAALKIEALLLWHKPLYSAFFLTIIELIFIFFYFLPLTWPCSITLICGVGILINITPKFIDGIFCFDVGIVDEEEPHHLRSLNEISAYFAAVLSCCAMIVEVIYCDHYKRGLKSVIQVILFFSMLIAASCSFGDFFFFWILFHLVFVLPGIILQPLVYHWLFIPDDNLEDEKMLPTS